MAPRLLPGVKDMELLGLRVPVQRGARGRL
jgi:hypothetical protein